MKRTDILLIVVIALFSVMLSYFALNSIIGPADFGSVKVPTVEAISSDILEPDPMIFNSDAINPAVEVTIVPQTDNTSTSGQ